MNESHVRASEQLILISISARFRSISLLWLQNRRCETWHPHALEPALKRRALERRKTPIDKDPSPTLDGDAFHNGTMLGGFIKRCVRTAILTMGRPARDTLWVIPVAGPCAGSETLAVCLDEINSKFEAENIKIYLEMVLSVENNLSKNEWGRNVNDIVAMSTCCLYLDVAKLCRADPSSMACLRHNKMCVLPTCGGGLIGGFSCKDFSRQNQNRKHLGGAMTESISTPSIGRWIALPAARCKLSFAIEIHGLDLVVIVGATNVMFGPNPPHAR